MPKTFVRESTLELRANIDAWLRDFEQEYQRQATKTNRASEARMRSLLRQFTKRVYIPYRDSTLNRQSAQDRDEYFSDGTEDEEYGTGGEEQGQGDEVHIIIDDDVDLDDLGWATSEGRAVVESAR